MTYVEIFYYLTIFQCHYVGKYYYNNYISYCRNIGVMLEEKLED